MIEKLRFVHDVIEYSQRQHAGPGRARDALESAPHQRRKDRQARGHRRSTRTDRDGERRGTGVIENGVMMQYFHWLQRSRGTLWNDLAARAAELAKRGHHGRVDPACVQGRGRRDGPGLRASTTCTTSASSTRRARVRTKYGTKDELLARARGAARAEDPRLRRHRVQPALRRRRARRAYEARKVDKTTATRSKTSSIKIKAWTQVPVPRSRRHVLDHEVERRALHRRRLQRRRARPERSTCTCLPTRPSRAT